MKGREIFIAAGPQFPRARALSGIAPLGESSVDPEASPLVSPSEPPRAPRVALVVATHTDETLFASSPVLRHLAPRVFRDAESLAQELEMAPPDACVLDVELPLVSRELLARVAARAPTLVILGEQSLAQFEALENTSADFVRRPLDRSEVDLRLSRLLRRQSVRADGPALLRCGSLEVDVESGEVRVQSRLIKLRRLELKILVYLIQNERRWIAVEEIQRHVLGTSGGGGSVRTHIWEIRNKLTRGGAPDVIQSERGKGYRAIAV